MSENKNELVHEDVTGSIIGAFYYVYNYLGFGFLESVYAAALTKVLRARGHLVEREVAVEVWFEDEVIARQRLDMLVDKKVVVELKAADRLTPAARLKLANYLVATGIEVGLVLHFGPKPTFLRVYMPNSRDHLTRSA
jgi:GxxExxY protein